MNEALRATILATVLKEHGGGPVAVFSWRMLSQIVPAFLTLIIIISCLWYSGVFQSTWPKSRFIRKEYIIGVFLALFFTTAYLQEEGAYSAGKIRFTQQAVEEYDSGLIRPYEDLMKTCTTTGCYVSLPEQSARLIKGNALHSNIFGGQILLKGLVSKNDAVFVDMTPDNGEHIYRVDAFEMLKNATPVPAVTLK